MKTRCRKARKRLMAWMDAHPEFHELDAATSDHLSGCSNCRRFAQQLADLRADGKKMLHGLDSRLGTPDVSFLADAAPQPHARVVRIGRPAAAAILAISIGFGGYFGGGAVQSALKLRSEFRAETGEFVESLFSEPLFHDPERISEVAMSDFFSGPDIVSDLVLPDDSNR